MLYYAEGTSSQIRHELTSVQKAFSDALLYSYKLLDSIETYDGINNLAVLNKHPGEEILINDDLFRVLTDTLSRMETSDHYSIFAGALFNEWTTLRYLEDPSEFDPVQNADESELLTALTEIVHRPGMFRLELTEPNTASLSVSPDYQRLIDQWEIIAPVLDLNLIHDAWMLQLTSEQLERQGYKKGYLYTDCGCSLWLDDQDSRYTIYSWNGKEAYVSGLIDWKSPSAFVQFTAFPLTVDTSGYYHINNASETIYRHSFINIENGMPADSLLYAALAGNKTDLIDLKWELIDIVMAEDPSEFLRTLPDDEFVIYTKLSSPNELHIQKKYIACLHLNEQSKSVLITH